MTNPFTPISATTDEVVAALRWSITQVDHAEYVLHRDRKISRHIAGQKSREYAAYRRALHELLKSVEASRSDLSSLGPDLTG